MDQYWLTIVIVLLIAGIIFDGVRRMRKAKRDSIKMALRPVQRAQVEDDSLNYGSEFPNGGARPSDRHIDPERIKKVRNKYNFGTDMSAWRTRVAEKIAEHTGMNTNSASDTPTAAADSRIEPSFDPDPLMDNLRHERVDDALGPLSETDSIQGADEGSLADQSIHHDDPTDFDHHQKKDQNQEEVPSSTSARTPVQTSLNLEDSVPMLMDSVEGDDTEVLDEVLEDTQISADSEVAHKPESSQGIFSVGTRIEPESKGDTLGTHSANKPRYESKYAGHTKRPQESPQEVLVIHVKAAKNEYFYGSDLLELILNNGLRYGEMKIFHRHAGEDGEGPILFSMSNMVKPGVFDLHDFEEFSTVGLSFFLALPTEEGNNMDAFDKMLATAKDIANNLSGELNDEQRSVLTGQTIEHYRERIRDFARRQRLEKSKS